MMTHQCLNIFYFDNCGLMYLYYEINLRYQLSEYIVEKLHENNMTGIVCWKDLVHYRSILF